VLFFASEILLDLFKTWASVRIQSPYTILSVQKIPCICSDKARSQKNGFQNGI